MIPGPPMLRRPAYPPARKAGTLDILHGVPVADPYRWLEDQDSAETRAWVEAQNALTASVLDRPVRRQIVQRLWTLFDYPRTGVAIKRGRRYFVAHNTGLQNQPVLYAGQSSAGPFRTLIDQRPQRGVSARSCSAGGDAEASVPGFPLGVWLHRSDRRAPLLHHR